MRGGWYCSRCGYTTQQLPAGMVTCQLCGTLGLRGYENPKPVRVPCPVDGCGAQVWDDGGVTSGELQHRYERHGAEAAA